MTNERKQLLSDEECEVILKNCAYNPRHMDPVREARAFYQRLITEGKLRVMEEATWIDATSALYKCSKCGILELKSQVTTAWGFCPGCGNPIKR